MQGGTIQNNLTVNGILTTGGQANFSANIGGTGTAPLLVSRPLTGNVTGDVSDIHATNATTRNSIQSLLLLPLVLVTSS